jgi:hypothetical protein
MISLILIALSLLWSGPAQLLIAPILVNRTIPSEEFISIPGKVDVIAIDKLLDQELDSLGDYQKVELDGHDNLVEQEFKYTAFYNQSDQIVILDIKEPYVEGNISKQCLFRNGDLQYLSIDASGVPVLDFWDDDTVTKLKFYFGEDAPANYRIFTSDSRDITNEVSYQYIGGVLEDCIGGAGYVDYSQPLAGKMYNLAEIEDINSQVSNINSYYNYDVRSVDVFDESTEGGELFQYQKDDEIVKMALVLYGETGKVYYEYFFYNNDLIYISKVATFYNAHILDESFDESKSTATASEYFFDSGEMILAKENSQELGIADDNYAEVENKLLADADRYREIKI